MPNSRRRRFSVQKEIRRGDPTKLQNGLQISSAQSNQDIKLLSQNLNAMNTSKFKSKCFPNSSKNSSTLEIVAECEITSSDLTVKTVDKYVTASSSTINLFNILNATNDLMSDQPKDAIPYSNDDTKKIEDNQVHKDKAPGKRDKYPHQHRIKVRSPKRKVTLPEEINKIDHSKKSVGVNATDWNFEPEIQIDAVDVIEEEIEIAQPSVQTLEDMCRICHGGDSLNHEFGQMISACSCRGTVGRVHVKCLERWLTESGKTRCELCGTRYATRCVHRYGVLKALIMWILSQNAKQLMVDGLGIMLMSPLAVLAAWLSGRTLAGLMAYESNITPWPLASTFVLACMTLVCYYCWIVSAATRHALAWWIWYRSQYEVRLQLQEGLEE